MATKRIPSGIPSLDDLIEGGFPKPSTIGVMGDVGSGKTILCQNMVWAALQKNMDVLYYTIDYGMDDVIDTMESFGWDIGPYVTSEKIHFVDIFAKGMEMIAKKIENQKLEDITIEPEKVAKISYNLRDMISAGKKHYFQAVAGKPFLVIYDSLTPIFSSIEPKQVLRFLQYMKFASRVSNAVGIAVLQYGVHGEQVETACSQIADGVLELGKKTERGSVRRSIRIVKMAKTKIFEEYCPLEITPTGIMIHKIPLTSL